MTEIRVVLPKEQEPFAEALEYFVKTMVLKLHINRHKGYADGVALGHLLRDMQEEVDELKLALDNTDQFSAMMEAIDVANFAFLMSLRLMQMTRKEYEDAR